MLLQAEHREDREIPRLSLLKYNGPSSLLSASGGLVVMSIRYFWVDFDVSRVLVLDIDGS